MLELETAAAYIASLGLWAHTAPALLSDVISYWSSFSISVHSFPCFPFSFLSYIKHIVPKKQAYCLKSFLLAYHIHHFGTFIASNLCPFLPNHSSLLLHLLALHELFNGITTNLLFLCTVDERFTNYNVVIAVKLNVEGVSLLQFSHKFTCTLFFSDEDQ